MGQQLHVSADAAEGSLRVAVLGADGRSLDECDPITADVTDGVVTWRSGQDLAALTGSSIRLQLELTAAKLYTFGFMG